MIKSFVSSKYPVPQRVIDRIFDGINTRSKKKCWEWNLSIGTHGYGQIGWYFSGKSAGTTAHRVAWVAVNGPIPEGMTIDHLCRNRKCVNPNHLQLLTNEENASNNGNSLKTHCVRGHAYEGDNLYKSPRGDRRCRECAKITHKIRQEVA